MIVVLFFVVASLLWLVFFAQPLGGGGNVGTTDKTQEKTQRFAEAIARAEGFYVSGSIPQRAHNPGDLKLSAASSPLGYLNGHTIFSSDEEGWNALFHQIELMRTGTSRIYKPEMTFEQIAQKYAENWQPWLANVTRHLNVSSDTTLQQYYEA